MLERDISSASEIDRIKAQDSLSVAFELLKRYASLSRREYFFRLYRDIYLSEDAFPLEESLSEVFRKWCKTGNIEHTGLFQSLESDFSDLYPLLQYWFTWAKKIYLSQGHDGSMLPFKQYRPYAHFIKRSDTK